MVAIGLGRVRYGGTEATEGAFQALARTQVRVEGPTVVTSGVLTGDILGHVLPRFVQALSKGIGRIKRGPGYPS
jgi:hypothetical protein